MSSLAITAFVCSVMSCSEESNRGYLVASDDAFVCSCDIVLGGETSCVGKLFYKPPKRTETKRKRFLKKKTSFGVGMELKQV